ncbi:MAG: DUF359 domain-containing protein [Candidatus Bathyarchaeia archaeon]|nr:DUF359 domain-containing protein [Candidatus Bathyarchaeota archaeon]
MSVAYSLPTRLRRKLKKPLGELIRGSYEETMGKLKLLVEREKPPCIVSVGDVVSRNLVKENFRPKLLIVDNRVMRSNVEPAKLDADEEKHVKNPPGTITFEALNAIQEAFKTTHTVKIVVDGEEDLLALPAIQHAPENALVIYGQPHEGLVVVRVTLQKKAEVAEILEEMLPVAKD